MVERLFTPFSSKRLSLANRLVMAPMTRGASPGHVPGEGMAAYYRRRAEEGIGLILTEGTIVDHPAATAYENVPGMYGAAAMGEWRKVVDAVHAAGGKIIPQLWHCGAVRKPGVGPDPDCEGVSPSGLYAPGAPSGRAMTPADIATVIDAFARSAKAAREVGFDGIELHGAHGYLIDQFLWEGTNRRDDEYGGSIEKRSRFVVELVEAVRDAVGAELPIILRLSQWKQQDYSARLAETPEDLARVLRPLADAGVDVFDMSTRRFWLPEFDGSDLNLAGWARKLTGKPAITVGGVGLDSDFFGGDGSQMQAVAAQDRVTHEEMLVSFFEELRGESAVDKSSLDEAVRRLGAGEFDLVAVGRALIADPSWPSKVRSRRFDAIQAYSKTSLLSLN